MCGSLVSGTPAHSGAYGREVVCAVARACRVCVCELRAVSCACVCPDSMCTRYQLLYQFITGYSLILGEEQEEIYAPDYLPPSASALV